MLYIKGGKSVKTRKEHNIMQNTCLDNYSTTFSSFPTIMSYHEEQDKNTRWVRCKVKDLQVEPLDKDSALYADPSLFASGISVDAVKDTADNLGLAITLEGETFPVRTTAYKSLLDRAKIGGTALPKLKRPVLAGVVNDCLKLFTSEALVLIRDEKIAAVHSGDATDYSVLPINRLLEALQKKLDERFPGNQFEMGYTDHAITSATWMMPKQKEELIGTYAKLLISKGDAKTAAKLMPGIRFMTSDTGISSAKVSALLLGSQHPIHIGGCIEVDHRHQRTVDEFEKALDQLFAQYEDGIKRLEALANVHLDYPVNAMTRVCKKLSMPKKAALAAISIFEMVCGSGTATAHDVFLAMQEIPFNMKCDGTPEAKMIALEENMARALRLNWKEYDLAKAVEY